MNTLKSKIKSCIFDILCSVNFGKEFSVGILTKIKQIVYRGHAPGLRVCKKWFGRFRQVVFNLYDQSCSGPSHDIDEGAPLATVECKPKITSKKNVIVELEKR